MLIRSFILISIVGACGVASADSISRDAIQKIFKRAPGPEKKVPSDSFTLAVTRGTPSGPNSRYELQAMPSLSGYVEGATFKVGNITRTELYRSANGLLASQSIVERTGKHHSKIMVTRYTGLFGRVHVKVRRE